TGLSTSGSISLGCALVAGRNLVPQPAAGKTALRTRIGPRSVAQRLPASRRDLGRVGSGAVYGRVTHRTPPARPADIPSASRPGRRQALPTRCTVRPMVRLLTAAVPLLLTLVL